MSPGTGTGTPSAAPAVVVSGVGTYALVSVNDVQSFMGTVPTRDAFWIYCSASDATAATVAISDTAMTLIITGGASAGTVSLSFALAANDTLGELISVINAQAGWTAGRIYHSGASSTDLVITGTLSCLGAANQQTLKIDDNYLLERLIDRATDFLERYCERRLMSRDYTREVYDGTGATKLILAEYPVSRVSRVSIGRANAFYITNTTAKAYATAEVTATLLRLVADGGTATELTLASYATITLLLAAINAVSGWSATAMSHADHKASELLQRPAMACVSPARAYIEIPDEEITDYHLLGAQSATVSSAVDLARNQGILYCSAGFTGGPQSIFVDYTAGFLTAPYALEEACCMLVKYRYDTSKTDKSKASETMGDYSYTAYSVGEFKKALPADLIEEINLFRKFDL